MPEHRPFNWRIAGAGGYLFGQRLQWRLSLISQKILADDLLEPAQIANMKVELDAEYRSAVGAYLDQRKRRSQLARAHCSLIPISAAFYPKQSR